MPEFILIKKSREIESNSQAKKNLAVTIIYVPLYVTKIRRISYAT